MVLQKARKQGSVIVRENVIVLYLAHKHSMCYKRAAKYRTMTFSLTITDPCFLCFLHHHCLQILHPTNFLMEKVFYLHVQNSASSVFGANRRYANACRPKDSGNGRQYASLFRIIRAANRCWRPQRQNSITAFPMHARCVGLKTTLGYQWTG